MKVLFISSSPINKSVSIGNTFLNVFNDIEDIEYASIYTRGGLPEARIKKAFRITEKMILKGRSVGEEVIDRYKGETVFDNNAVSFVKKKRWTVFFWAQSIVWKLPFWKSKKLKAFLNSYNPDVIFTVLSDSSPLNSLIYYIHKYTKKPLVLYAWDDNYSMKTSGKSPLKKVTRIFNRAKMRKIVHLADKFYVISQVQKVDYEKWFKTECKILTKSADFSLPPSLKESYSNPLQLIFTGNIGMNRWRSLSLIASALHKMNQNGVKAQLRIYTGTPLTVEIEKALQMENTSFIMGSVPANMVLQLQTDADMLVHVEGLDKKSQISTRQSFSTKLVDYFKAARPILAVGPCGVASMEHLIQNDCAITAQTEEELYQKLLKILEDKQQLDNFARKAYECGKKYHNKQDMQELLRQDLDDVIGQGKA